MYVCQCYTSGLLWEVKARRQQETMLDIDAYSAGK